MTEKAEGFGGIGAARTDPAQPASSLTPPGVHKDSPRDADGSPKGHDSFSGKKHG